MHHQGIECWLSDMDGVLTKDGKPVPGAADFVRAITASGRALRVITNTSAYTPGDLSARMRAF